MLTNQQISKLFQVPLGTVCSWGSKEASKPHLYNFLKVLPSENFVKEVLSRNKAYNVLNKNKINKLFNCKKSKHLDLIIDFINKLKDEEIKELLKRLNIYIFLINSKDLSESINSRCNDDLFFILNSTKNNINTKTKKDDSYFKILNQVKKIKEKNPYALIKISHLKHLKVPYKEIKEALKKIEKEENIPITSSTIIKKAIEYLKNKGEKVTIKNIQKITNMSYGTIQKFLKEFK
ncbi:hypothetical protein [Caminibacter mediatlanticus]|uniref:Uncharacterized protein n=1 Tax=Caminibacter mediatlanticus TB-2 TaxID=391592 RepID=A0AAI9F0R4_9BACT|nr:hypothetical protein [Caminibacter mediatlanticus]EDM22937.1 hypothetical protein CMTB2_05512 [Caminibacter mediatlanticus TB-2]